MMLNQLESDYNCANASTDLPNLMQELQQLEQAAQNERNEEQQQQLNRIRNQIHFIQTKCDIPGKAE
ncbi:hypothetical protein D3C78_836420 [compost metagenome]